MPADIYEHEFLLNKYLAIEDDRERFEFILRINEVDADTFEVVKGWSKLEPDYSSFGSLMEFWKWFDDVHPVPGICIWGINVYDIRDWHDDAVISFSHQLYVIKTGGAFHLSGYEDRYHELKKLGTHDSLDEAMKQSDYEATRLLQVYSELLQDPDLKTEDSEVAVFW